MFHLRSTLLTIFFVLLFSTGSTQLMAKDSITWMEAVAPPFFIHDGPLQGQGYEDLITQILKEKLPQYEHTHIIANISRHYQQWKQGEKSCSLAMFKTPEREEFVHFSIPSVFTLPIVLIIHKNSFDSFGGNKTVSLQALLESGNYVIGRSNNRSYGVPVDSTLDTYGNDNNIFAFEGPDLSQNLFKMLIAGRINALPALPEEAMYLAETLGFKNEIMTLSVSENQGDYSPLLTYVACSKTEWGKKVIDDINQVLLQERPSDRYRAAYERWLDSSSIDNYRKLYNDVFLTINK